MTDHGLEWLGRLLIEPRRLWRRYLVGNLLFLYRVLKQQLAPSLPVLSAVEGVRVAVPWARVQFRVLSLIFQVE